MARQLRRDARGRFSSTGTVRQRRPETAASKPTKATKAIKASAAAAGPAKAAGPPKTTTARGRALTRQREANRQLKAEQKGGGVASVKTARSAAVAARAREYYAATGTGTKRSPTRARTSASTSGATKAADLVKKPAKGGKAASSKPTSSVRQASPAATKPARTSKAPVSAAKKRYRELTSNARRERNNPSATPRTIGAAKGAVTRFENTRGVKGGQKRPVAASAAAAKPARTRKAAVPAPAAGTAPVKPQRKEKPSEEKKPRPSPKTDGRIAQLTQSRDSARKQLREIREKMKREGYSGALQLEKIKIESKLKDFNYELSKANATTANRTRKAAAPVPAPAPAKPARKPQQASPAATAPARSNPRAERARRIKATVSRSGIVPGSRFESGQAQRTLSMAEMRSAVRADARARGVKTQTEFNFMFSQLGGVTRVNSNGMRVGRTPQTRSDWERIYRATQGVPQSDRGRKERPGVVRGIDIHQHFRPWAVFGLNPKTATREDVNQAFRKLAIKNHPDQGGRAKDLAKLKTMRDSVLALMPAPKPAKPTRTKKRGKAAAQAPPAPRGPLALPPARGGAMVPAGGANRITPEQQRRQTENPTERAQRVFQRINQIGQRRADAPAGNYFTLPKRKLASFSTQKRAETFMRSIASNMNLTGGYLKTLQNQPKYSTVSNPAKPKPARKPRPKKR